MKYFVILLLATIYLNDCAAKCVKTHNGRVSGKESRSRKGQLFWEFRGIPYAEPPVGHLRFREPVPAKPWHGTLKAYKDGPQCMQGQYSAEGSEDCLYLNVFTSQLKPKKLLHVLVNIHAGSYVHLNASSVLTGPQFLMDTDIVLVTFNYRLGIFGFLSNGDKECPGNFGLKDQVLALEWVQQNIAAFGGDPNEVTLFGEGAGGESAHLHALSEKSKHLFKRIILQSGTALNPNAFTSNPSYYDKPKQVGKLLNCPDKTNAELIECLRKADAKNLNSVSVFDKLDAALKVEWRPTKEPEGKGAFLTDTPENLIQDDKMKKCPIISGNDQDEGTIFTRKLKENKAVYDMCVNDPIAVIERLLSYYDQLNGMNLTELAIEIKNYYFGEHMPTDSDIIIYNYTLLVSDALFFLPQRQFLDYIEEIKLDLFYSYYFKYRGALSLALSMGGKLGKTGVAHNDILFYIFGWSSEVIGPEYHIQRTKKDYEIVDALIDLWTTFSRTSVPHSPLLGSSVWTPYTLSNTYLQIGDIFNATETVEKGYYDEERIQFWYNILPTRC